MGRRLHQYGLFELIIQYDLAAHGFPVKRSSSRIALEIAGKAIIRTRNVSLGSKLGTLVRLQTCFNSELSLPYITRRESLVTRIAERTVWVRKFLRHGTKIASLTPSSRWLCGAMCRDVDPTRPQAIVELGTGTGPLTQMVLERMHPESTFLSIEVDPDLHAIASARCPKADIANASVENLPDLLAERDIEHIDVCLSCLPIPSLPQKVNKVVFDTWKRMNTTGTFTQITQVPWWYQTLYRRVFREVKFELVMMNPPPGGVYHCSHIFEDFFENHRLPGKQL